MYRLYFAIALSLTLAVITNLANAQPFNAIPTGVTDVVANGGQFRVNVPFVVTDASNPTTRKYAMRTIKLSKATTGALAKARMFTPWGLALQAAMVGVGYYIDTQEEKVYTQDPALYVPQFPIGSVRVTYYGAWSGTPKCAGGAVGVNVFDSLGHALQHIIDTCDGPGSSESESYIFNPNTQCYLNSSTIIWRDSCPSGAARFGIDAVSDPDVLEPFETTTIDQTVVDTIITDTENPNPPEVTDEQIATVIEESPYTPELIETTINDPDTNRPVDINIAEIAAVIADLIADLEADADADPLTLPTTDSDTDNGLETVTEVEPTQQVRPIPRIEELTEAIETATAEAEAAENPVAESVDPCVENPDTLMCLDTTGEFNDDTLTEFQIPFDITPISLASNSSCPNPETINLSYGSFDLEHDQICGVLEDMRPLVILLFSIAALFVIGAVKP